jgi:hypothetical protein
MRRLVLTLPPIVSLPGVIGDVSAVHVSLNDPKHSELFGIMPQVRPTG